MKIFTSKPYRKNNEVFEDRIYYNQIDETTKNITVEVENKSHIKRILNILPDAKRNFIIPIIDYNRNLLISVSFVDEYHYHLTLYFVAKNKKCNHLNISNNLTTSDLIVSFEIIEYINSKCKKNLKPETVKI